MAIGCRAQNPILDISEEEGWNNIQGAYYKDIHNLLDPFEGTYVYANGNTIFKIVLQKKLMSSMGDYYYEDLLIGEYQYIENGIDKVNTLNKLNIDYSNKSNHSIDTNFIITSGDVGCEECQPGEKALYAGLVDSSTNSTALLIIRQIVVNNQPAIKIFIGWEMKAHREGTPEPMRASFPGGYYTLLKQ